MSERNVYRPAEFLRDVYGFVYPYRRAFWVAVLLRLSSDIVQLFPGWALSQLVVIITNVPLSQVFSASMTLVLLWTVALIYLALSRQAAKLLGHRVSEKAALNASLQTLQHIYRLDLNWQETEQSGNKLKRISKGRDGLIRVIRMVFDVIIEALVNTIGIVIIFSHLNQQLALGLLAFIVTFYVLSYFLIKQAGEQEQVVNEQEEELEGLYFESLNNIRTVKALSIAPRIVQAVWQQTVLVLQEINKSIFLFRRRNFILDLYYYAAQMLFVVYLLYLISLGQADIGLLVLFINYYWMVGESVWELAEITRELVIAKIGIGRMMTINRTEPVIEHPELKQAEYSKNWQKLQVRDVSFKYEGIEALTNVSFCVKRGEKIGIVGLSGAGKSTLFKLLMDLYENYQGDILLDEVSLKNMHRSSYIDHVAVVLQETELFNASLADNILLAGTSNQQSTNLDNVIKMAHLQQVVEQLPKSVKTVIGEKGFKLSGGERQRVGIARALYRQPDILLLDEATSHLDVHSEREIQSALSEFFEQVTAIVIAHRLSTITEMDRILVLEGGRIIEEGSFAELIKKSGVFAKMWREQKL